LLIIKLAFIFHYISLPLGNPEYISKLIDAQAIHIMCKGELINARPPQKKKIFPPIK